MSHLDPRLQLVPPGTGPRAWLFALCVALPVLFAAAGLIGSAMDEAPMKKIGGSLALTAVSILGGVLVLTLAVWAVLVRFMRRQAVTLDAARLEVRSSFYRASVPLDVLDLDRARVVDLDERDELRPLFKSNSFSLPGYRSGWFRLRNRRRTFVALADGRHRLWLPTRGRHDLLLEPKDPRALLQRLLELAAGHRHG